MAQNGTKENGVAEEIPALPLPLPVKVQDIRHTKVRGLQAQLLQVGIVSVKTVKSICVFNKLWTLKTLSVDFHQQ